MGSNGHKAALPLIRSPRRVVSLVPSITQSLVDLGFGETLVGVSDYCPIPEGSNLPQLGGPKEIALEAVLALKPDLVIANREENCKALVENLQAAGVPVWVTFPRSVAGALEMLWEMVQIFQDEQAAQKVQSMQITLEWARSAAANTPAVRFFCPIWEAELETHQPWWMTGNQDTYLSDLLSVIGGQNVFARRERRYPLLADLGLAPAEDSGERDVRYPRVSEEEVLAAQPELILLPSEPFPFTGEHRQRFCHLFPGIPAVQNDRIYLVEGSLVTWYGTRLANALLELPPLIDLDNQD